MKIRIVVLFILVFLLSACGSEDSSQSTSIPPMDIPTATTVSAELGYSAENPVTANNQWMPVVQTFDGVEMVLVPAGCFTMGSTDEQVDAVFAMCETTLGAGQCRRDWFTNEQPTTEICFDEPFWIDRYEVTNGQFAQFGGQATNISYWPGDSRPRENLTWSEARDFCALREARLPTEAEWEYAARGPDGFIYPWGNEFDGTRLNFCDTNCEYDWKNTNYDDGSQYAAPVGSYEGGESWVEAYDLSGNVWEWVSTIYRDYPYDAGDGRESNADTYDSRVVRGGSLSSAEYGLRAALRLFRGPNDDYLDVGFRCARSFE